MSAENEKGKEKDCTRLLSVYISNYDVIITAGC
jgi:hypothetical protein